MESYHKENVAFNANGITLRGWLYKPNGEAKFPAIIMAHGYACVKELYLDKYAEVFVNSGFVVLVYDHRNFGESDAPVPQEIDPIAQVNDWRDAITYMQTLPFVDKNKIGIWGSSLAGGHVITVGALDKRVKCIVAQVPTISGARNIKRRIPIDNLESLSKEFVRERINRYEGKKPATLPIMTDTLLKTSFVDKKNDYRALFDAKVAPESEQWRFKNVKNEITLLSLENYANYNPEDYLKYITPTPILMIVGDHDTITMSEDELAAFSQLHEPKKLLIFKGGHFNCYHDKFNEVVTAANQWFKQWLR